MEKIQYNDLRAQGLLKIKSYGFKDYEAKMFQESIDYDDSYAKWKNDFLTKYLHLDEYITDHEIIPSITHIIYIFPTDSTATLSDALVARVKHSSENLNNVHNHWQHYFWTNKPDNIPKEIKEIKNLIIKDITEFKDQLLYKDFAQKVEVAARDKHPKLYLVQASDILRLLVLYKYGGIYHDCDYEIYRGSDLYNLTKSFNLIMGHEKDIYYTYIGNAFIAVSPNHNMIKHALELVDRNLHKEKYDNILPLYVKYPFNNCSKVVSETGPTLVTVAYYHYIKMLNDQNLANNTIVFPYGGLYNKYYARLQKPYDNDCKPTIENLVFDNLNYSIFENVHVQTIGSDMLCVSWQDEVCLREIIYTRPIFEK